MYSHFLSIVISFSVVKDGIRVGVCETHFREQMEELSESEWVEDIQDQLDVDRAE